MPTCLHVGLQNRRFSDFWRFQEAFKISSFFASIFYRFWLRFGSQVGAMLATKTPPRRPQDAPKTAPRGLQKTGSPHPVSVLAAKSPPRPSRTPPGPLQDRFLGRFWKQLGCVLPPKMHQNPLEKRPKFNANLGHNF